jgi:hypothetical protein
MSDFSLIKIIPAGQAGAVENGAFYSGGAGAAGDGDADEREVAGRVP